ncbi:leukocyte cell-derived chemotaxin 1 [Latimeria chalumnae]|uniref:Leukocyte cell-derived chemotaxin 1 n=1 Tax=Latimeria chalumnae TaxID=7897 RepID=H3A4M2_LATCH|nr:PREDICTED: leukocyte cell-derived chemotaxin 1 [Latimeria chalumnae]|eukprot:XP_006003538.1 PREDICTED: leukocyte cell-derived chemotaxin 1 [Latimeria chalumnae]
MAESSEKIPITLAGPDDVEQCLPPAYTAVTVKSSSSGRLLKLGAVVLISGAVLLLFGAIGAFYFWKVNDKHVYNVHYSMSINGKVQEGSMEIDTGNNLETFKTGSGSEEAVEVHDFQIGITGIRFSGGEKCYIKAQAKAHLPDVDTLNKETLSFDLEDEIMPAKFDEDSLIWVAAEQPVKDSSFLSHKILELCGDLPIFWLRPTYPKDSQRKKREIQRKKRQAEPYPYDLDQFEAAAEEVYGKKEDKEQAQEPERPRGRSPPPTRAEEKETKPTFNPENPYHQMFDGEGTMTFDPMLDHQGICCSECRRSYTHCQRICEPLLGYYPWPYDYRGCRVACRIIMPCSWWVGRILGVL